MAIFKSFDKNFEVTAISFSPNIITIGEETSYSISIKNVSGKKVSSMRAELQLYYRDTAGAVRGSNSTAVYSGTLEYGFKSISWANGATKTFTGKFVFSPLSSYPPNIDTRLLPLFKVSDIGYSGDAFASERLGLRFGITADVIFGDFFNNADYFFDLRGENSEYLYVIDARYKPSITAFTAERSTDSEPNDEGENLLSSIALSKSAAARPEFMSLYLYYQDKARPDVDPVAVDLTSLIDSALADEIHTVISEILDKNADWNLLLWFGDKYESTTSAIEVSRSFANVHLSGASTGGVCFGSFSKATEGNPLFQCYYPSRFYAGIDGVTNYSAGEVDTGGRWIDGKRVYRSVLQFTTTLNGTGGVVANLPNMPETLISARGFFSVSGSTSIRPIPFCQFNDLQYSVSMNVAKDSSNVSMTFGTKWSGTKNVCLILEYTKVNEEVSS
ncbi:MAG: hypothetical protein IJ466_11505 [Clostridia bacterium]|nr:hypothetical protein [Clostridia bacterium]